MASLVESMRRGERGKERGEGEEVKRGKSKKMFLK